jgi:hypothetical protein
MLQILSTASSTRAGSWPSTRKTCCQLTLISRDGYRKVAGKQNVNSAIPANGVEIFKAHPKGLERIDSITRPIKDALESKLETSSTEYNKWELRLRIWHPLILSQLGQLSLRTLFAFELFLGKLAIRFRPPTGFPRGGFGICNDSFCERLEVCMCFPRIPLFSPDLDELDVRATVLRRREDLRSRLVVANDVVLVGNASQILVTRTKEPCVEVVFLGFRCEDRHFVCS